MARETKVGLLIGLGVILLVGIIVSDHLSVSQIDDANRTPLVQFGQQNPTHQSADTALGPVPTPPGSAQGTSTPLPTAQQIDQRYAQRQVVDPGRSLVQHSPLSERFTIQTRDNTARPNVNQTRANPGFDPGSLELGSQTSWPPAPPGHAADVSQSLPTLSTHTLERAHRIHVVKPRETLRYIATDTYGDPEYWRVIAEANPQDVTANGQVAVGTRLIIPSKRDRPVAADSHEARSRADQAVRRTALKPATIKVQPGDSLSELASEHLGSARRWRELLKANHRLLDGDARNLRAGMTLRLPADATPPQPSGPDATANKPEAKPPAPAPTVKLYVVRPGDSLTSIAEKTLGDGAKYQLIFEANRDRLADENDIQVGQKLVIPAS